VHDKSITPNRTSCHPYVYITQFRRAGQPPAAAEDGGGELNRTAMARVHPAAVGTAAAGSNNSLCISYNSLWIFPALGMDRQGSPGHQARRRGAAAPRAPPRGARDPRRTIPGRSSPNRPLLISIWPSPYLYRGTRRPVDWTQRSADWTAPGSSRVGSDPGHPRVIHPSPSVE